MNSWFEEKLSETDALGEYTTNDYARMRHNELWIVNGAWIDNSDWAANGDLNIERSDVDIFRKYTIGFEPMGYDLENDVEVLCAGRDPKSTMATIASYGELWNADVTAIGIDGLYYQTEPAYGYVDILSKMTYVPDEVFDAIVAHIKANSPIEDEPQYSTEYATYYWRG